VLIAPQFLSDQVERILDLDYCLVRPNLAREQYCRETVDLNFLILNSAFLLSFIAPSPGAKNPTAAHSGIGSYTPLPCGRAASARS
jgi:hypothetical protein